MNKNAIQFYLSDPEIVHENIYKNILRDVRKFYHQELENLSHEIDGFNARNQTSLINLVKVYVERNLKDVLVALDMENERTSFEEHMTFLVYARQMLAYYADAPLQRLTLTTIYAHLYNFSMLRLKEFISNKYLYLLTCNYALQNYESRVRSFPHMRQNPVAYMEALSKMLTCSDFFQKFDKTFKFDDFLERVSDLKPKFEIADLQV